MAPKRARIRQKASLIPRAQMGEMVLLLLLRFCNAPVQIDRLSEGSIKKSKKLLQAFAQRFQRRVWRCEQCQPCLCLQRRRVIRVFNELSIEGGKRGTEKGQKVKMTSLTCLRNMERLCARLHLSNNPQMCLVVPLLPYLKMFVEQIPQLHCVKRV